MKNIQFYRTVCGITGVFTVSPETVKNPDIREQAAGAIAALAHRGPDSNGIYCGEYCILGQTRLNIIDNTAASDQPFYSKDNRYALVYNGEIFNFKELRADLAKKGIAFHTNGDTEVLLNLYIHEGRQSLEKLNGFFAFAVYDTVENSLFIARDRYGMKPLYYSISKGVFYFASEMKALLKYPVERRLDYSSLLQYLQLNYVPAPDSMLEGVKKIPAGSCAKIKIVEKDISFWRYCKESYPHEPSAYTYGAAKKEFFRLLDDSVQKRLIADVPLGTFLSGGLDSSAVTAIASLHKPDLMTFSIGYKNEPIFDESRYAELVSRKLKTQHHCFMLDNNALFEDIYNVLNALDEPFGDSSAVPMYILSAKTRAYVKVALSGDGGDELLGGYNKHRAEVRLNHSPFFKPLAIAAGPLLKILPMSRNDTFGNLVRKASKFAEGASMNAVERYWRWASVAKYNEAIALLQKNRFGETAAETEVKRKQQLLYNLGKDFNSLLYTDMKLVLQNDMLVKTDLMSMSNSLEVRMPLLDYRLVEFCFSLPAEYKITATVQKKILRESVAHLLPEEVLQRKKHGFEAPLLKWFRTGLRSAIESEWLNDGFIKEQGLFDANEISGLKQSLYSASPGDSVARIWGLIAFQNWYRKYF